MNKLREGISTGSCAAAGAAASALWQSTGICPKIVTIETPIARMLAVPIEPISYGVCGVMKDAGDDPDVTNGCYVIAQVEIGAADGEVQFKGGRGIGRITQNGLKLPIGETAINPVPRQMIRKELRKVIGQRSAVVTISIPNGEELAKKTYNERLGIVGGLSILGTTGIVRPMSEDAVKDSLSLELRMRYEQGCRSAAFVLGAAGEQALRNLYGDSICVVSVSNYIGYMLDKAAEYGYTHILIGGYAGKLVKLAAGIMNTHSRAADGRMEVLCTYAALAGAPASVIQEIHSCLTTKSAISVLEREDLMGIWNDIIKRAVCHCEARTARQIQTAIVYLDSAGQILAQSRNTPQVLAVLKTKQ